MRVCVDEARQNGDVAEIEIGSSSAARLDSDDAITGDDDDAALQRWAFDGKDPAGGEGQVF